MKEKIKAWLSSMQKVADEMPEEITKKEPESEKVKVDETRFKAIVSMLEAVLPQLGERSFPIAGS